MKEKGTVAIEKYDFGLEVELVLSVTDYRSQLNVWVPFSTYSYHIKQRKYLFNYFNKVATWNVLMGNDMTCSVARIGSVTIRMHDGT